ncbi:glycoside hydrolase family 27 protein [Botryobasidium botryosum FD-172 SS1]|uniref:Alpha-galactosidase n=1 Tax=Botryobasidium botryosum (strain FD-172 SS1) TaxID=930990 RepID=A0A067M970_BOTB1|nr:glycoside hydrolase family 27 protein [Botryobasidium botryosum FD-172 SS1]
MSIQSRLATTATILLSVVTQVDALNNGVAQLPVMGYNTWNAYHCDINQNLVVTSTNLMKSLGLLDAGYNYINIDDCYALKNRSAAGLIVADPVKFPMGMANLTSYIHSLGFKAGIYSDSGWQTCAGFPGSYSNELVDAQTFHSSWGFDLLKYDNCAVPYDSITHEGTLGRFKRMSDAIASVAATTKTAPMVFSLCEWGWKQPWLWAKELGQSWRTTGDIGQSWDSITSIINFNSFIAPSTDFYGRNDLDILEVGNSGLTYDEARSHWTAWALLKSPLLIGTNLSAITKENLDILTNREIIAINQDPVVGTSITPFRWGINPDWTSNSSFPAQYWSGQTQNGTVIMLLNTLNQEASMSFNFTESPWLRWGRQYSVRDLWTHTDNGTAVRSFTAQVPAHGVAALLLKDAGDEPAGLSPPCAVYYKCTDQNGTLVTAN